MSRSRQLIEAADRNNNNHNSSSKNNNGNSNNHNTNNNNNNQHHSVCNQDTCNCDGPSSFLPLVQHLMAPAFATPKV